MTAVFVSISLIGFLRVSLLPDVGAGALLLSFVCVFVLLLVQLLWYTRDNDRLRSPLGYAVLGTQALLGYLPMLVFGEAWVGMPGFFAGSLLLVLRPFLAWPAFGVVVASTASAQWVFTATLVEALYAAIFTVTTGLVVYGLSRLSALVAEVRTSRAENARLAVLRERLRFARDLHDLLGYSLSAITLKIELTHRLMESAPQAASDQLLEVLEISRLAMSDARMVATGYREMSLEEECRSAMSVLAAAEVAVRLESDHIDLPVQVSTVLATVLREGVTNLLRHSKAKHCAITIRQDEDRASIEILNDALPARQDDREQQGVGGLHNLSVRAKEAGGTITVVHGPNVFRLRAEVPLRMARHAVAGTQTTRGSEPAGVPRDADGVDTVASRELADDRGEVVPDGAD
ncbi:sensor histidine kinase [Actinophytocola oryzae]|uniref:sensor histidine kinase n=1 Tax=Actinophytocola oryzae TaxID=502181 RepID=UPI001062D21D|nr:histidine kinase [Actinophytocola oryzae]